MVSIVMGSDSDLKIMEKAERLLKEFDIACEMRIISAHRQPDIFFEYAQGAMQRGVKVIIAGAGLAAHLPGMSAALFPLPVIGVPMSGGALNGTDALYSIVQMPPGVAVATVGIDAGLNAGLLAAKILAVSDETLRKKLIDYHKAQRETVLEKDRRLQEIGSDTYLRTAE